LKKGQQQLFASDPFFVPFWGNFCGMLISWGAEAAR
jgi:hypothetical protein